MIKTARQAKAMDTAEVTPLYALYWRDENKTSENNAAEVPYPVVFLLNHSRNL